MANVPTGGLSSGGAAFGDPLVEVPQEARTLLWRGMVEAVDLVLGFCEQTPPGTRYVLPPRVLEHCGERFNEAALARQALASMRQVWRIECWLAADALEALILDRENSAQYAPILAACCTRIGQIYAEIKRRYGTLFALLTLRWEVRMLRYRGSLVIEPLLFEHVGRPSRRL